MIKNILEKGVLGSLENALFIIDKEAGRTSHDEVHFLRKSLTKVLGRKIKVGHSGTLDPKVTGVLVLGSGRATKTLEYILLSRKEYIAEFLFHKKVSEKFFRENLEKFLGKISQLPPVKSAVKRQMREREVYDLKVLDFAENGRSANIFCAVERGTYIRKLAHDLGVEMEINTSMGDLVRVRAGVFAETNANIISQKSFSRLLEGFFAEKNILKKWKKYKELKLFIYPLEEIFQRLSGSKKMKKVFVKKPAVKYILAGAKPRIKNLKIHSKTPEKTYTTIPWNSGIRENHFDDFEKGEIVSLFYKKKVLAVGEFLESLSQKDFEENGGDREFLEKEILKLKKVFG